MKKTLVATAIFTALPFAAQADLLFTVGAKASLWNAEPTGQIDKNLSVEKDGLNLGSENGQQFSIFFEHPLPVVPNIKLKSTSLEVDGKGTINAQFAGQNFNETVTSKVDLSHNDLTLYWGLPLPVPALDINFGLTARQFAGEASVASTTAAKTESVDLDMTLPMVFGEVKVGPIFGVYANVDANYVGYNDNKLLDWSAALGYVLPIPVVDVGLEVGYRSLSLQTDKKDVDIETDLDVKGLTYGLSLGVGF